MTVQRSTFGTDPHSAEWHHLEREMLALEVSMARRDGQHHTGGVEWLKGLHCRHNGQAMPKDRVR